MNPKIKSKTEQTGGTSGRLGEAGAKGAGGEVIGKEEGFGRMAKPDYILEVGYVARAMVSGPRPELNFNGPYWLPAIDM